MVKSRLYGDDVSSKETAKSVLLYVLENILKLLHPFMPYITEEIWQNLNKDKALIVSDWPRSKEAFNFNDSEETIEYIKTGIKSIRNARAEMNIEPSKKANAIFVTKDDDIKEIISEGERYFQSLAGIEDITITNKNQDTDGSISVVLDRCEVFLPLKDLIDINREIQRLEKEKEKLESEIKRVAGKLSNEGFVSKAPRHIVDEEKAKQKKYEEMLNNVMDRLNDIKKLK